MNHIYSERLKKLRNNKGKTQDDMAQILGIKRSTYGEYERGKIKPPFDKIMQIAKYFDVSPSYIMGWQQEAIESAAEMQRELLKYEDEQEAKVLSDIHAVNLVVGNTLQYYRTQNHKTLEEMSEELGIPSNLLAQYEAGLRKIPFDIVQKIADYFHIDTTLLIGLDLKKKSEEENDFTETMRLLEMVKKWNEAIGRVHFKDEELEELINFANFIIYKRNK